MNYSNTILVKLVFLATLPVVFTACDAHFKNDPVNELQSDEKNVACSEILNELDKKALSNERQTLNDNFKSLIYQVNKVCTKSFQRDFSVAQFLAVNNEIDSAVKLLENIESNNQELEVQRLDLLFWIYLTNADRLKVNEIINYTETKYPNNVYTFMMVSVYKCSVGNCKDQLGQLIKVDNELRKSAVLPFLAQSYAENGDFQNASQYYDKAISISGIEGITDKAMYHAVISNLNTQRDEVAKNIYISYSQIKPYVNTVYTQEAKAALDSLGLLDSESK